MVKIRKPSPGELIQVLESIENGRELDDREIWIWREYLE